MINLTRIHANIWANIRFYHDFWPKFPFLPELCNFRIWSQSNRTLGSKIVMMIQVEILISWSIRCASPVSRKHHLDSCSYNCLMNFLKKSRRRNNFRFWRRFWLQKWHKNGTKMTESDKESLLWLDTSTNQLQDRHFSNRLYWRKTNCLVYGC